jgi:hypothetical protein
LAPLILVGIGYQLLPSFKKALSPIYNYWPVLASLLMWIPLLTARSQRFHPWYFAWIIVWWPLVKTSDKATKIWQWAVIATAISSQLRYLPYLWAGEHTDLILSHQQWITWGGTGLGLMLGVVWILKTKTSSHSK